MHNATKLRSTFIGLLSLGVVLPATAQTPVATYQFSNNLLADQPGVTALTAVDPAAANGFVSDTPFGVSRPVYRFAGDLAGGASSAALEGGLQLNTTGLIPSNSYSVEMVFSLDQVNGYRRITETQNRTSDNGFYVISSALQEFPQATSALNGFAANTYYDVVLTVSNAGSNNVTAYLNSTPYFTVTSTDSNILTNTLNFFLDNGNNEYSNGKIALVRLFDAPLTSGQVTSLYNNGNPFPSGVPAATPEPGTFALFGAFGGAGLLLARKRRRRTTASA